MNRFDHENLDVYQVAIDLVILIDEIVENLPRGRSYLADQFLRAGTSVVLNIAEGAKRVFKYRENSFLSDGQTISNRMCRDLRHMSALEVGYN
jgi:four helix bundle protein